eukprot:Nitzschia sp. Nitz4//scaffold124_size66437//8129//10369//NITZ4_006102-RA/size66437-processed-gene-0.46-mRNA-1//-1//CDS//3329534525//3485//frame0
MMGVNRFLSVVSMALLVLSAPIQAASDKKKDSSKKVSTKPAPRTALVTEGQLKDKTFQKLQENKRLNRREKKEVLKAEIATFKDMKEKGFNEVANTKEAALMRNFHLRNKKKKGIFRKKEASLSSVLFPGVSPEDYPNGSKMWMYADLVESRNAHIPYEFYDLPGCPQIPESKAVKLRRERKNLGARLQGHDMKPAPFALTVGTDMPCSHMCTVTLDDKKTRFLKRLIERQYRVQLQLDSLPVLYRVVEHDMAIRGYPLGFRTPLERGAEKPSPDRRDYHVYNHLKFTITHTPIADDGTLRITAFDVIPVSITHEVPASKGEAISTCTGFDTGNDPSTFLTIPYDKKSDIDIVYSYDVTWVESDLEWADRWDVYLVATPDDEIHYYSILNSLLIVTFMTGAIATIMIRTLRKDIAGYNDLQSLEEEETGWKLVHGDVFRPPQFSPMLLSVLVGTGAQIGCSAVFALLLSIMHITSALRKGQILTSLILLYVLCGSVAGYISSRIYKFCDGKNWKLNSILTAGAVPGAFVCMFALLNVFLSAAGAATAVSILTIIVLFLLWMCVSAPLVFVGSYFGLKAPTVEVPTKTKQIARVVPEGQWHMGPAATMAMGGLLPFGSVCIELAFIMSALWLHQIYYVMGFLLAVVFILAATCAQVSIVLCYLQLCAENHRWWWISFLNCATSGAYLFLYSLYFLSSKLHLVGVLPVIVYLTYMSMISVLFGLFCGSMGFLSSFWFTRIIYGAVKVD